jgi:N-glycosylase/DNA lyase
MRAKFIYKAREHKGVLEGKLHTCSSQEMREWLAGNVLGLGYKEASHFLRNIGITDLAIIDFHIIDLLVRYKLIDKPKSKSLTKKKYLEIEQLLARIAQKAGTSLAELDLYLWYMETGKVLK